MHHIAVVKYFDVMSNRNLQPRPLLRVQMRVGNDENRTGKQQLVWCGGVTDGLSDGALAQDLSADERGTWLIFAPLS